MKDYPIEKAISTLTNDGLVAIPTETVYGLAANAYSDDAVKKIFELKNRPFHNPLIVHIHSADRLCDIASDIPAVAYRLAEKFWPGPLTLLLKKKSHISDIVTAGHDTVAVRVPNHSLTLTLLKRLPFPLVAPSANPFGSISATCAEHVRRYFGSAITVILDGGSCEKGVESTIVGFDQEQAILYRHGAIPMEDIEPITGKLVINTHNNDKPQAPGMLTRHYAPDTTTYLTDDVLSMIASLKGKKIGLLLFDKKMALDSKIHQEVLSERGDIEEAAKNLYAALHRLDNLHLDIIISQRMPDIGLGITINDKLSRAAIQHT